MKILRGRLCCSAQFQYRVFLLKKQHTSTVQVTLSVDVAVNLKIDRAEKSKIRVEIAEEQRPNIIPKAEQWRACHASDDAGL